jgi:hypothetical protein
MVSRHQRNVGPMLQSPRCGARTRAGTPCRSPAVSGKRRCRMHGGAAGSGAPKGNCNAFKHGLYAEETIAFQRHVNALLRRSRELREDE